MYISGKRSEPKRVRKSVSPTVRATSPPAATHMKASDAYTNRVRSPARTSGRKVMIGSLAASLPVGRDQIFMKKAESLDSTFRIVGVRSSGLRAQKSSAKHASGAG